jgi:hypothetical protein
MMRYKDMDFFDKLTTAMTHNEELDDLLASDTTGLLEQYNLFKELKNKEKQVIDTIHNKPTILGKIDEETDKLNEQDKIDNPKPLSIQHALEQAKLTERERKDKKLREREPNENKRAMKQLYSLLRGEVNDINEVMDTSKMKPNDWRYVLYKHYVLNDDRTGDLLRNAGMLSDAVYSEPVKKKIKVKKYEDRPPLEEVEDLNDPNNKTVMLPSLKEPKFKEVEEEITVKEPQLIKEKTTPLTEIPRRLEEIKNYVIFYADEYPNENINTLSENLINNYLFATPEQFENQISIRLQSYLKELKLDNMRDGFQQVNNLIRNVKSFIKSEKITDAEYINNMRLLAPTREASEKRLEEMIYDLFDKDRKHDMLDRTDWYEFIRTKDYILADRDRNQWLKMFVLSLHKVGFPSVKDIYKLFKKESIKELLYQDGKFLFGTDFYYTKDPVERAELYRKANNLTKQLVNTYINEMNYARIPICNSLFMGEMGYNGENPWMETHGKDKEERDRLLTTNWLRGNKDADDKIKFATMEEIPDNKKDYKLPLPDKEIIEWKLSEDDIQRGVLKDKDKLITWLSLKLKINKFKPTDILESIYKTTKEYYKEDNNDEYLQQLDELNKLPQEELKYKKLAELILDKKIPALCNYSIDLRSINDIPKTKKFPKPIITDTEYKKLPMEAKIAYYKENPDAYNGLSSPLEEWNRNDELLGLDTIILYYENKKLGDRTHLVDTEYYKQLPNSCKRFIDKNITYESRHRDKNISWDYLPDNEQIDNEIQNERYKDWLQDIPDLSLLPDDFNKKYPKYENWKYSLYDKLPEPLTRYYYIKHDLKNKNFTNIPTQQSIIDYANSVNDVRKKNYNKQQQQQQQPPQPNQQPDEQPTEPDYELSMQNKSKIKQYLTKNNRLRYLISSADKSVKDIIEPNKFTTQEIIDNYYNHPCENAYAQSHKKLINDILKRYPHSRNLFNSIKNISFLTMDELLDIEKDLKSGEDFGTSNEKFRNSNTGINTVWNVKGHILNKKINKRYETKHGQAISIMKDVLEEYKEVLDDKTKDWIESLDYDHHSMVITHNIDYILRNKDNLGALTDILGKHGKMNTKEMPVPHAYPERIDYMSLFSKPEGTVLEVKFERDENKIKEQQQIKERIMHKLDPTFGDKFRHLIHKDNVQIDDPNVNKEINKDMKLLPWNLIKTIGKTIGNVVSYPFKKVGQGINELGHMILNDKEEPYLDRDTIKIIKNNDEELVFTSNNYYRGFTYHIPKRTCQKVKKLIDMKNEVVPLDTEFGNEFVDGVFTDFTQKKIRYNELEITEKKYSGGDDNNNNNNKNNNPKTPNELTSMFKNDKNLNKTVYQKIPANQLLYPPNSYPINTTQLDALDYDKDIKKSNEYNKSKNDIPLTVRPYDIPQPY